MRFLLYNIAYCTGFPPSRRMNWLTAGRYLKASQHHVRKIRDAISEIEPDVVGLLEVDTGSVRAKRYSQVTEIARSLAHYSHHCNNKYSLHSVLQHLPILRHQGNAVLTRDPGAVVRHYFTSGIKRLILEIELEKVTFFLVHLALTARKRRLQYNYLQQLLNTESGPIVLGGDFNAFRGRDELRSFCQATGLRHAIHEFTPTYPACSPRYELDFILCSSSVNIDNCQVLRHIQHSDHLPILLDVSL